MDKNCSEKNGSGKNDGHRQISRRTGDLGTENAFVVLAEVNAMIAEGKPVLSFCIGQPDFDTPDNIREAAIRAIRDGHTGYTASAGIDRLREVVAEELGRVRGIAIDPADVVCGGGAKPFIGYAVLTLTDYGAGHEVLYPNPGFPIYESQIRVNGAVPVPLHLLEGRDFTFDPDDLRRKISEKTRLLILNTPHNPTGSILTPTDLAAIAEILADYPQVWVYADEIYSRLVYDGDFHSISSLAGMQERTIIADGISKTWAMTGWRLGYAVNKTLAPHFTRWVTNTESCASHITQWAGVEAISGNQDGAHAMKAAFEQRRELIVRLLNEVPGVSCKTPGGAFYVWPNVTEACAMVGAEDSEDFRRRLLHEAGIACLADIHFGSRVPGEGQHIRFSYAASNEAITRGITRMAEWVEEKSRR